MLALCAIGIDLFVPRKTPQRDAIHQALAKAGRPLSPQEVLDLASKTTPTLGLATVYRTLGMLEEAGQVAPVDLPGEARRYELQAAADTHHHHFQCDDCGNVYDVEGCPGGIHDILPKGFSLRDHEIILYGKCAACRS